jgi:hypothetical protein
MAASWSTKATATAKTTAKPREGKKIGWSHVPLQQYMAAEQVRGLRQYTVVDVAGPTTALPAVGPPPQLTEDEFTQTVVDAIVMIIATMMTAIGRTLRTLRTPKTPVTPMTAMTAMNPMIMIRESRRAE